MQSTAVSTTLSGTPGSVRSHAVRTFFSPEQRAAAQAAATAKRRQFQANAHLYKTDYLDAPKWREMASRAGLRMPPGIEPCSVSRMRTFLNRLSLPAVHFCKHYGYHSLSEFIAKNPTWTLFGFVGVALELQAGLSGHGE